MPRIRTYSSQLIIAGMLLLSAEAFARVPHRVAFNEAELAAYRGTGSGSVSGQLAITDSHGRSHVGSGMQLTLLPVTSYTKEMVDREIGNGEDLSHSDSRLKQYVRHATADDRGNFVFQHVPAGEYFVTGLVTWSYGTEVQDSEYQWACERIKVSGQTIRLKVSRNLQHPGTPVMVHWGLE